MSSILLIRHGQASFGAAEYDALSPLGQTQARILGETLAARGVKTDLVLSGGMQRHRQTASGCLGAMSLAPSWEEDRGWDEYDHKDVIARFDLRGSGFGTATPTNHPDPKRAFQAVFEKAVARWTSGEHDGDYRESWPTFTARVEQALERLLARLGRSQTALVFTSGGSISIVCRKLLKLPDSTALGMNWTIANASVTKLLIGSSGVRLSTFNEHAHFEGANAKLLSYR